MCAPTAIIAVSKMLIATLARNSTYNTQAVKLITTSPETFRLSQGISHFGAVAAKVYFMHFT